ncbi:MAG: ATP-binding protein, partial [Chloroflexi bacterium]|nr:ATP-binding protein [Chloroflexota bacterium]
MAKDRELVAQQEREYDASNIQKLDPREHIRRRPGMYVGGTDARALHHLIYEVVDNSIDEALSGRCDSISVTLHKDGSATIRDNGVGIPVDRHESGKSALEVVMTEVGSGGKFDNEAYKVSGGLHGVGVSAVNALSASLTATIRRDGHVWRQSYEAGIPTGRRRKGRELRDGEETGTEITFVPDFTILEENEFSFSTLMTRFREMAFVTRKVTIRLRDERVKPFARQATFYFDGGLRAFVRYLNRNRKAIHNIIHVEREVEYLDRNDNTYKIGVEVAFQYSDVATTTELAFTNTINTPDGGTHITG